MTLSIYIGLALTLLAIGLYGLISSKDMLKILISIEIAMLASIILIVLFASISGVPYAHVLGLLVLFVSAAETAMSAALAILLNRETGSIDVSKLKKLREETS